MGWTSYHAKEYKRNGKIDICKELDEHYWQYGDENRYNVLKSSMVGNIYYAAVRNNETKEVFAAIFKTGVQMNDYYNFSYKDMDETVVPCYYDCPKGILDILTPTDNENANYWRGACHKHRENKNLLGRLKRSGKTIVVEDYDKNKVYLKPAAGWIVGHKKPSVNWRILDEDKNFTNRYYRDSHILSLGFKEVK